MQRDSIDKVAVVGGGLIGLSWASLFTAFNLRVTVYDPNPSVATNLKAFVEDAWPHLLTLGLAQSAKPIIPEFTTEIEDLKSVDFVQECGPDRIEIKRATIVALEACIDPAVVIASSTSSLLASDIQQGAVHPGRVLVAHPMNPPHLIPMVELVAGDDTSSDAIEQADAFYTSLKRVTVRVKKEVVGHLANRLTSALYREAVYIAAEGIADVQDIDRAIAYGPGMRWALIGPHLTYHLGGGKGGYRHYLDHLGATQEARWREHGTAELTEELKELLIAGVEEELRDEDSDSLVERRDAALVDLAKLKTHWGF